MRILVVAATDREIAPFVRHLDNKSVRATEDMFDYQGHRVRVCISGIGMHRMAFTLGQAFAAETPDLCINAGIAGCFPHKGHIGEVVRVTTQRLIDFGAEDGAGHIIAPEGIGIPEDISSIDGLHNPYTGLAQHLRSVTSVTSNPTHGNEASIQKIVRQWDPDIESMEGGAFFYCCLKANVPFIEIRGISNHVEVRDMDKWNIPLAVANLNNTLIRVVDQLFDETTHSGVFRSF